VIGLHIALGVAVLALIWTYLSTLWGAPWARTSREKVDRMLRLADVQPGETVVDLGAGDGRIVIRAARRFGACAIGVEVDPLRWLIASLAIRALGLRERARVVRGNMFAYDISEADVVTLYLLQGTNQRLKPHLAQGLRPGARVVSHAFPVEGWAPLAVDRQQRLYLYQIGAVTDPSVATRIAP
jgi:precorrin-6B methylase 2